MAIIKDPKTIRRNGSKNRMRLTYVDAAEDSISRQRELNAIPTIACCTFGSARANIPVKKALSTLLRSIHSGRSVRIIPANLTHA